MSYKTLLSGQSFTFDSVKEVLAKANEEKSGDILAGVAAKSGLERIAAKEVLAGMTLSLLGQGAGPVDAAACAVWLHSRAGDFCAQELTAYAMTPADLLRYLPAAFKSLGLDNKMKED